MVREWSRAGVEPSPWNTQTWDIAMKRTLVLLYGLGSYLFFFGVLLYAIGFVGGFGVPTTLDGPVTSPSVLAVGVDLLLLIGFGLQHSVMARPAFKRWWTQYVPPEAERSTYVLFSNLAMVLLFWQWRPLEGMVWDVQQPILRMALYGLFASGWLTIFAMTCLINHFDLFGLRQVWLYYCGVPYTPLQFVTPAPYRMVRHPLYVGWLLTFWATPTMSAAHLFFALGMTAYILIAIQFEERDLVEQHANYEEYRCAVPMLIPRWRARKTALKAAAQPASSEQRATEPGFWSQVARTSQTPRG